MAAADIYAVASGLPIYAGMAAPSSGGGGGGMPAYITNQAIDTWGVVPGNTLASIDPDINPLINPNYPGHAPWYATPGSLVGSWNSVGVDPATGDMWLGGAGGHTDRGGNDVYVQPLRSATPNWVMLREPDGSINIPITDGGSDNPSIGRIIDSSTGLYHPTLRPRPTHTYAGKVFVPGLGLVLTTIAYAFPNFTNTVNSRKAYLLNKATNDWELFCDYSALGDCISPQNAACYDSLRHCIWIISAGAYKMLKIDCTTRVATQHGILDNHTYADGQWAGVLKHNVADDLLHFIGNSLTLAGEAGPSNHTIFDPVTNLFHVVPTHTGSFAPGMVLKLSGPGSVSGAGNNGGAGWDEENKQFLLWGTQADIRKVSTLTRPTSGNPRTTAWVAGYRTLNAPNTVTPTAPATNQTFGRFDYVACLGICFLLNADNQPTYFYKIKALS